MIGHVVGSYRVLEKIGEGGMGAVYKGIDLMLEREVAIKVLRPELAHQPHVVARFRTEAVTLARLNHPNIATLYSFLREGEDFFMIMEFVRGETLDRIIQRSGPMEPATAVSHLCQALDGIQHAYRLGIVHRDLKPANIMLTEANVIKVMDFGIARALGAARMTQTGNLVGTIEYMAPEQILGQDVDTRADIYALGVLLYEMLTGRAPFQRESDFALMRAQVEDAPTPPRKLIPGIPKAIEQAIMQALEKKPDARFPTAADFRDALQETILLPVYTHNARPKRAVKRSADPKETHMGAPEQGKEVSDKETRIATALQAPNIPGTRIANPALASATKEPLPSAMQDRIRRYFPNGFRLSSRNAKHYAGLLVMLVVLVGLPIALLIPSKTTPSDDLTHEPVASSTGPQEGETTNSHPREANSEPLRQVAPLPIPPERGNLPLQPTTRNASERATILNLMLKATEHFKEGRLSTPAGNNALEYCGRILMLQPENQEALQLIRSIMLRYAAWADTQVQKGDYSRAVENYKKAIAISELHPTAAGPLAESLRSKLSLAASGAGHSGTEQENQSHGVEQRPPNRRVVQLANGTEVRARLTRSVSSADNYRVGDLVAFVAAEPVKVGSITVIKKDAALRGEITAIRKAGAFLKGELRISLRSVETVDGKSVAIRAEPIGREEVRGREVVIAQGSVYLARIAGDTGIATR